MQATIKDFCSEAQKDAGRMVSISCNAFTEGCLIQDALLIANKVNDSRLTVKIRGSMSKLDIGKMYIVFLYFHEKWMRWTRS